MDVLVWWTGTDAEPDEVLDLRGRGPTPKDVAADWWLDRCHSAVSYYGTDGDPVCVRWTDGQVYAYELEVVPVPQVEARRVVSPHDTVYAAARVPDIGADDPLEALRACVAHLEDQ